MKNTVKIFAWIGVVIGGLAILSLVEEFDFATFLGGGLFLAWGIIDLTFISKLK